MFALLLRLALACLALLVGIVAGLAALSLIIAALSGAGEGNPEEHESDDPFTVI